jgi:glycine betaine transporter
MGSSLTIEMGKKHSELFKMSAETQLFGVFNHLPLGMILSLVALILIMIKYAKELRFC